MFNPNAYANSRGDGIGVLEFQQKTESDKSRRFVPLKRTEIGGELLGPLAVLTVSQLFGYSSEQCSDTIEALYRFPLPGDSAITGVRVTFGSVEIRAELKAREGAEADYQKAKKEGHQATLLTREAPDVFTLKIAGIQPDQDVLIETTLVQLAETEGENWRLRIPLTTAPRYVRSDELGTPEANGQPLALLRDPGHLFSLDIIVPHGDGISSSTHELDITQEDDHARVRLKERYLVPDRDCVITWRMEHCPTDPKLHILTYRDPESDYLYFLALVAPPATPAREQLLPRDVILLVDHSLSMEGAKRDAADWATKRFLSGLTDREAFNLGLFNHRIHWLSKTVQSAEKDAVKKALTFIDNCRDFGGTELGVALEQSLGMNKIGTGYARHVLIITDAQVSDESRILRLAKKESKSNDPRRISVLCIDSAPNAYLANKLAYEGGGVAKFVTSDPNEGDIATALDEILSDWNQPILKGLRLEVDSPNVQASARKPVNGPEGWSCIDMGDLPLGRTVWVAGRISLGDRKAHVFRLTSGEDVVASVEVPSQGRNDAIKALFGAWMIQGLEHLCYSGIHSPQIEDELSSLGYDPTQVLKGQPFDGKIYHENSTRGTREALSELLVTESLEYGLLTSATGFIAVRTEQGQVVEKSVIVANALPHGWSDSFIIPSFMRSASPTTYGAMSPIMPASANLFADPNEVGSPCYYPASPTVSESPLSLPQWGRMSGQSTDPTADKRWVFCRKAVHPSQPEAIDSGKDKETVISLFTGCPNFLYGRAVLYQGLLAGGAFTRIQVRLLDHQQTIDPNIRLLLFVNDMATPWVKVHLQDILLQGGERPINLQLNGEAQLMLVLENPTNAPCPDLNISLK
jgi:Ca-activated chloride channel family protein